MTILKRYKFQLGFCALLLLSGCASEPKEFEYKNLQEEVAAIKEDGGIYKVGNPYTVLGQSYTPWLLGMGTIFITSAPLMAKLMTCEP